MEKIIKARIKINKIEAKKIIEKNNEIKSRVFFNVKIIDKLSAKSMRKPK